MKKPKIYILLALFSFIVVGCSNDKDRIIDLSGTWKVSLDSTDIGISEKWYTSHFENEIKLPGTLCEAGYGTPCNLKPEMEKEVFLNLKRKYDYVGIAWYSREVTIPSDWKDKDIVLTLERVLWESQLWIDDKKVDVINESLIAPHTYHLAEYLTPGKHKITLRIDNRKKYDISMESNMAHAYTNETQTMWNGVLGNMTLEAKEKVNIENILIYPDVDNSKIHVQVNLSNQTGEQIAGNINFFVKDAKGNKLETISKEYTSNTLSFDYEIKDMQLWDEFNPHIYEAIAEINSGKDKSEKSETFGMRKLTNKDALLQINGQRMFLRGTLECCIFPLTGYPPTDVAEWEKVFLAAKDYGLNHIRFHSWCPPKAAFIAADQLGMYLQVELPVWILDIGKDKNVTEFLYDEADRIIAEYGNHPSFCFWSLGNELQGDFSILDKMVADLKQIDSRHLYTTTTFTFEKGHGVWPEINDDFWISQWTKKGWVRGQGIFDDEPVNFNKDYSASIDSLPVPIVTHEIGQYSVYPNLKEIEKYTGNLIPLNFMAIEEDLKKKGRFDKADDYLLVSGKLAAILYKEEIERALKTPGVSGFQLLDLHDFPGQGTALVGILDAFWDSKGIITPEEFRRFNSPVVPLARFEKATYTNDEIFEAGIEVANFSGKTLKKVLTNYRIYDSKENPVAEGKLQEKDIPVGNAISLGNIHIPLFMVETAERLTIEVSLADTEYINSWEIWVYPEKLDIKTDEVVYTQNYEEAERALAQGKKVFLNPRVEDIKGLEGKFVQVFWSPVHFPNQPGTMGILCNPEHPAFNDFPTEMHSNWQWWDICKKAQTMELDAFENIEPIITMVDNFYKNRNLGLIFEAKVGNGKLLVCSSDLNSNLQKRPVARQLKYSLLNYMKSDKFNPEKSVSFDVLKSELKNVDKKQKVAVSIYD